MQSTNCIYNHCNHVTDCTDLDFVFEQKIFGQASAPLRCFISKMRMGAEQMAIREAEADMNILSKRNRPFRHDLDIFFSHSNARKARA